MDAASARSRRVRIGTFRSTGGGVAGAAASSGSDDTIVGAGGGGCSKAAAVGTGAAVAGTVTRFPQILHLADRPAYSSGTRNVLPHS